MKTENTVATFNETTSASHQDLSPFNVVHWLHSNPSTHCVDTHTTMSWAESVKQVRLPGVRALLETSESGKILL